MTSERVGPVRRVDIPLSAIDFHCSDIVPAMLTEEDCFQPAAALAADPASGCEDAEKLLRKAMWMFRSSQTQKQPMLKFASAADAVRTLLEPFWKTVAAAADGFSAAYIKRRFA